MFPTWSDWDITYTAKGLAKKRTKATLSFLACATTLLGLYRLRKNVKTVADTRELLKRYLRMGLMTGAVVLQTIGSKV